MRIVMDLPAGLTEEDVPALRKMVATWAAARANDCGWKAGDTARNIETLEAMLRVERRQVKRWRNSFASAPSPETQRALAFLGGRIAALKGAILALQIVENGKRR